MIPVVTEGTQAKGVVFSVQRMKSIRLSKIRAISAQHHLRKNSYLEGISCFVFLTKHLML